MKPNIIVLGPSLTAKGGIVSVVKDLSSYYNPFVYITTTSLNGFWGNFATLIKAIFQYVIILTFKRVDIVHIHSASNNSFRRKCIFVQIAKHFDVKIIVHMHGGSFKEFYENNKEYVRKHLSNEKVSIIALSEFWRSFFVSELGLTQVYVLPNPIPHPISFDDAGHEKVSFLFVGRISREKGCYDLIDAISDIKPEIEGKAIFRLAGLGNISDIERLISENKLDGIVECIGWVEGEQKQREYAFSDCFILPSYIEGLPVCVLEAMSYKLPIIATTVGSIPEIVDSSLGILVPPGDVNALKDAILEFVKMPVNLKEDMAQNSYKASSSYYNEEVLKKLDQIYLDIYN